MGVMSQKGPNPFETNSASLRYTQLSQFKNDFMRAGLPGDAEAIFGRGYIVTAEPVQGDVALLGNRIGVVTAISKTGVNYNNVTLKYKNQVTGNLDTIQIVLRSTVTVPSGAVLGGHVGYACSLGTILFIKSHTTDQSTWTQEARNAEQLKAGFPVKGAITQNVTTPVGDTAPNALALANHTKVFTIAGHQGTVQWQRSADGVTYTDLAGETGTTYTVVSGHVIGANYFRAKVTKGALSPYTNAIRVYYKA